MATGTYPMPLNGILANINLQDVQRVSTGSINSITSGGVYLLDGATELPEGSTGWLFVTEGVRSNNATYLKQIFFRIGTPGTNDNILWHRSKTGALEWGSWWKIYGTKGSEIGDLSLSNCSSRGKTYVARYGGIIMVHFSVKTSSAISEGTTLATFPSGIPTTHVSVNNVLCITESAGTSYTINVASGVISANSSIPTSTQLIADIPLVLN